MEHTMISKKNAIKTYKANSITYSCSLLLYVKKSKPLQKKVESDIKIAWNACMLKMEPIVMWNSQYCYINAKESPLLGYMFYNDVFTPLL